MQMGDNNSPRNLASTRHISVFRGSFGLVWFIGVLRHINDISVIYVTAQICRRIEEVVPTVGLPTP